MLPDEPFLVGAVPRNVLEGLVARRDNQFKQDLSDDDLEIFARLKDQPLPEEVSRTWYQRFTRWLFPSNATPLAVPMVHIDSDRHDEDLTDDAT